MIRAMAAIRVEIAVPNEPALLAWNRGQNLTETGSSRFRREHVHGRAVVWGAAGVGAGAGAGVDSESAIFLIYYFSIAHCTVISYHHSIRMSNGTLVKAYAVKLVKQKEYKTRAQKQLKEFEEAFEQSKAEFRTASQALPAVRVNLGESCDVVIRRKVTHRPGTFTQKRLENLMTNSISPDVLSEAAVAVSRELQEMEAKEREKQARETRKRERQEELHKKKEEREAKRAARDAMEGRVAQVKRMIQTMRQDQ